MSDLYILRSYGSLATTTASCFEITSAYLRASRRKLHFYNPVQLFALTSFDGCGLLYQDIWANEERKTLSGAGALPKSNHRRLPASLLQKMAFTYATTLREESLGESDADNSDVDSDEANGSSDTGSSSSDECVYYYCV